MNHTNINYTSLLTFINSKKDQINKIKEQYINLMSELTLCPNISTELFVEKINQISLIGTIIIGYIELSDNSFEIVGSGTIIIEPKIIRLGMSVGHIEDIVVKSTFRGKKISQNILNELKKIASESNCYKVILDCDESVCGVYKSNGFEIKGFQMGKYF